MSVKAVSWSLLILLSMIWGSSFILMKRGLEAFSSDEVAALRISIAFLSLLPLMIRHYRIDLRKYWKGLVLMGICGNLIPAFLFTYAETTISSSLTGMLNSLTPLFAIIIAVWWLKFRPSAIQVTGVVTGFAAAAALMFFEKGTTAGENFGYGGLVVIATVLYAVSVNAVRKYLSDLSSVAATLWGFTVTGPIALTYLLTSTDAVQNITNDPAARHALGFVVILAVCGSAISVILYNVLIKQAGVLFASSCTYLIPVVAVLWGLADGEAVTFPQVLSIVCIIFSVYLINRRE